MIEKSIKHIEDRIKFSDLRPEIVIKKESAEAVLSELEIKDKMINLILGEYIDSRYSFEFIESNKRKDKRKEVIDEYIEHYRKKVLKDE